MKKLFERAAPRLAAIVALQVLILLSILAFRQYTVWTSETILLSLDTTNPQDLVGRASLPARYDISRVDASELPGDDDLGLSVFAELDEGSGGIWVPVAVHDDRDHNFEGTVLIKGENRNAYDSRDVATYDLHYGIENVHIAEGTPGVPSGSGHVVALEVRVDHFGEATPKRFLIDGRPFAFEAGLTRGSVSPMSSRSQAAAERSPRSPTICCAHQFGANARQQQKARAAVATDLHRISGAATIRWSVALARTTWNNRKASAPTLRSHQPKSRLTDCCPPTSRCSSTTSARYC